MSVIWAEPFTSSAPRAKKRKDTPAERKHTREEWEARRDRITELFEDHELPDVVSIMANEGFEASIPQYRIRLKNWGHFLKLTEKQWRYIGQKLTRREKEGKKRGTAFRLNNKKIPSARLEKELALKAQEDNFDLASLRSAMSVSACSVSAYTTSTANGVKTSHQRANEEEADADRIDSGAESSSPNASRMRLFRRLLQTQKQLRETEMELRETQRQLAATEAEADVWYTKDGFRGESQLLGAVDTVQAYYRPILQEKSQELEELGGSSSECPDASDVLRKGYESVLEAMDREITELRQQSLRNRRTRQSDGSRDTTKRQSRRRNSRNSPKPRKEASYMPCTRKLSTGAPGNRGSIASPCDPSEDIVSLGVHSNIRYHFDETALGAGVEQGQMSYFSFFREAQDDDDDCEEDTLSVGDVLDGGIWNTGELEDNGLFTNRAEISGLPPSQYGAQEDLGTFQQPHFFANDSLYWNEHRPFFSRRPEITT